ncbi:MAG: choice-of-anchor A family protein [Bacilli bacterium]
MNINFWLAESYNIFVFNNHSQNNSYATGQVWVGRNATYKNYSVAADVVAPYIGTLTVLGDMDITGGINYFGNSELDVLGNKIKYTMVNNHGAAAQPTSISYRPYDINSVNYLEHASVGWASLPVNTTVVKTGTTLTLTGTSTSLNNFLIDTLLINISTINNINIIVPSLSTVLINITGTTVVLNNFNTQLNNSQITLNSSAYVLWNFPETLNLEIHTDIYGSLLSPYASITSSNKIIYGTLMTKNLDGNINGKNNKFLGTLPDLYDPSTTGSSTSFTSTTSTTSSSSTTTVAPCKRCQAIIDLTESVALEQTSLSHIINAEGEKIQKALTFKPTIDDLLKINASVNTTINSISRLESLLQGKLELFSECLCTRKKL